MFTRQRHNIDMVDAANRFVADNDSRRSIFGKKGHVK